MTRSGRFVPVLAAWLCLACCSAQSGALSTPYVDAQQLTRVPFGSHSHWAQPWRATLETVPAATFLQGLGINWNPDGQNPDLLAHMLAAHGVRRARIEIGWGRLDYDDESRLHDSADLLQTLRACKKYGIRPLILLNSNQGAPCPVRFFSRHTALAARKGDQSITLEDATGLVVGHSGLSNLSDYWAAEALVTGIVGHTVALSKPLPKEIPAVTDVPLATLKYCPFAEPGSDEYKDTIAGWQRYVGTVARFASNALGTTKAGDRGFDMEVWNELTFGSQFLSLDHYRTATPARHDEARIWSSLVAATAAYADAHPADFTGVRFGDGFANTVPWPSAHGEPARITALDKHPYHGRSNYPRDSPPAANLNALYQPDPYVPTYSALFPEYFGTLLQTETILRDSSPLTDRSFLYSGVHGRLARVVHGRVLPCPVWITEVNINPGEDRPDITAARALTVRAKAVARYFCFYLNKGVTQVDLYAASGGDKGFGIVGESFLAYAKRPGATYPADDSAVTSPSLAATGRIAARMRAGLDSSLVRTRPLTVLALSDTHDHAQFQGDGTPAHPNLYDRDVFAFLPFQVNARRFVIPYYVMTRDVMNDMGAEEFTIRIGGLRPGAAVTAYDPLRDAAVPVRVLERGPAGLTLRVLAADYPFLLTFQESPPADLRTVHGRHELRKVY